LSPPPPPRRHSPPGPARPAPPTPPPPPPGRPPRRNSSDARMRRCSKAWKSRRGRTRSVDFVTAVARFSFRTSPRREPATPALSHRQSATQSISRDSLRKRAGTRFGVGGWSAADEPDGRDQPALVGFSEIVVQREHKRLGRQPFRHGQGAVRETSAVGLEVSGAHVAGRRDVALHKRLHELVAPHGEPIVEQDPE